jgi:hypothetical protein
VIAHDTIADRIVTAVLALLLFVCGFGAVKMGGRRTTTNGVVSRITGRATTYRYRVLGALLLVLGTFYLLVALKLI